MSLRLGSLVLLCAAAPLLAAKTGGTGAARTFRGITEPLNDATISAVVAGRVAAIKKKEGDFVKKDEVILELEKDEQELEAARRKLIADSKAEVNAAKNQMETMKLDYTATKQLFDTTQSVSAEELWKKELDYKLATGEYERLNTAEEREAIEHGIAVAQLNQRIVTAPFDGIVVKIHPHLGESANVQAPLVRVADIRKCRFVTYVEAVSAPKLSAGMKVNLRIDGPRTTYQRQGVVEYASPVVDPSSGLREVKVLFDNANGEIQPGVTGAMSLEDSK